MTFFRSRQILSCLLLACAGLVLSGCGSLRPRGAPADAPRVPAGPSSVQGAPAPSAPSSPSGPAPASATPPARNPVAAEAALAQGLQAYRDGKYALAEAQLRIALRTGLNQPADQANAHKHLAFVYCTSERQALCAESFRSARRADPAFRLSKAEAGHPMWGRTYRRALGIK